MSSSRPSQLPRMLLATLSLAASIVSAQRVNLAPTLSITETLTNNVNLEPSPNEKTDLITTITPALGISTQSAHTRLDGNVSMPIVIYARTGSENNQLVPTVNLIGHIEPIDNWLGVDALASVAQQYASPFGPRPSNIENATQNRYTSQSYSVTPYVTRPLPNDMQYDIRDTNTWTRLSNAPVASGTTAYTNIASATLSRTPLPLGWDLTYNRSDVRFTTQEAFVTESAALDLIYQADLELQLTLTGGYEKAAFVNSYQSLTYGAGFTWRPNERTSLNATWEHRYFGASYQAGLSYRTSLFTWLASASRSATSLAQQLSGTAGVLDVRVLLNQLFLTQFPDPIQRQQHIDQYIIDNALPQFIGDPTALFTQRPYIQEQASTSLGLLGVRNTVSLILFYVRSTPFSSTINPVTDFARTTDTGGTLTWTHNLSSNLTLTTSVTADRAMSEDPTVANTKQASINTSLSAQVAPNTSFSCGARYYIVRSNLANDVREAAIFATVSHTFR